MGVKNLYGEYTSNQIAKVKKSLRSSIFFLLLYVDPSTSHQYVNVDIEKCFQGLLLKISGMNELLLYQPEVVTTMSLLQAAWIEYKLIKSKQSSFEDGIYRKLILDAGAEIDKLREEE